MVFEYLKRRVNVFIERKWRSTLGHFAIEACDVAVEPRNTICLMHRDPIHVWLDYRRHHDGHVDRHGMSDDDYGREFGQLPLHLYEDADLRTDRCAWLYLGLPWFIAVGCGCRQHGSRWVHISLAEQ
ncbi:hypothetical protein CHELA1G11_21016 [Hyphomicrobiales bacterium]|nr:hypothetical protein CHELA1G11_21016 [Hyphomicrobiales bacterium]